MVDGLKLDVDRLQDIRVLHEQQRFSEIVSLDQKLCVSSQTEFNDQSAAFMILLAIAHHHLAQFSNAHECAEKIRAQILTLDADAQTDWAAFLMLLGRVEQAHQVLTRVLNTAPQHALALARRSWCSMALGDGRGAERDMAQSIDLHPDRIGAWLLLARLKRRPAHWGNASELEDSLPDLQYAIDQGRALLARQCADLSENAVDRYNYQLDELQLTFWLDQGRFSDAEAWIDGLSDQAAATKWYSMFAEGLAQRNHHSDAEDCLRKALKSEAEPSDQTPLWIQLSQLAELQGRRQQAIFLIRRALKRDRDNPQLWIQLSKLQTRSSVDRARDSANKALELIKGTLGDNETDQRQLRGLHNQAKLVLANIESEAQRYEQAEALFSEILDENPYHVGALRALGQQEMQRGRIDSAVALFEKVKTIDPVSGTNALINARHFPDDEETLVHLDRAARQPSLEGPIRSGILFQLAAAWEKRKDFDQAFAYAHEANEQSKQWLHYDPKAHRQKCARIRHAFHKSLFQHRTQCGHDSTLPIFVVGMPRSGTTLVEQMLASHTQIFGAGELGVIPQRIAGLERWERTLGSGRHYPDCVDDLSPQVTQGVAENIVQELMEYAAETKPDACHVVDKLPHNFENIGFIKFLFPRAKIISVRRDPRDIAMSNYFTDYAAKHGGMGFAYDLRWIGEQLADHNLLMHHWDQLFPGEILEVRYEDVVQDPEVQARRMLDYIGVPWEPQILKFNTLDRPVKTASVWQVRQPIYQTSTAKWRRYEAHMKPLIAGTNAKIVSDPIEMISLPVPGMFHAGLELYNDGKLDEAEFEFKKVLYHIPEHAAASHMVGIIYAQKGALDDAIIHMEHAVKRCPWNKRWRKDLIQALEIAGYPERAAQVRAQRRSRLKRRKQGAAADRPDSSLSALGEGGAS